MKIDIELLKKARDMRRQHPMFCQRCGETDPEEGFYPMFISGPDSIGGLLCMRCDKEMRG